MNGDVVKIDHSRQDLRELDDLGHKALKSVKIMDLVINGATLMSVNKDTLRGIIRVILTGAAAEISKLQKCRDGCKIDCLLEKYNQVVEERDRYKKLLDAACRKIYDEMGCPAETPDNPSWLECDGEAEECGDDREPWECWERLFSQRLQEWKKVGNHDA